jgi:hypothetical protein
MRVKMKISLLTSPNEHGSLYIMCRDLSVELKKLGHEVEIHGSYQECAKMGPDLLLNFEPKQMVYVQSAANRWWKCGQLVNVFSMSCETYTQAMMAGYLATGFETAMICISPAIYGDLMGRAKELFNPANIRKLDKNFVQIPYGVLDCFHFEKKTDRLDNWICPITRICEDKRFEDHQETTKRLMPMFRLIGVGQPNTDMFMSTKLSLSRLNDFTTEGYTAKPMILDRKEYAEALRKYAFAMVTCHFESFGLYYIELLLSGVVCVFVDYPWVKKLLPGYKYTCSLEDLPGMALYVRKNYDEAFGYLENEVIPFIRKEYLLSSFASKLMDALPSLPKGTGPRYKVTT